MRIFCRGSVGVLKGTAAAVTCLRFCCAPSWRNGRLPVGTEYTDSVECEKYMARLRQWKESMDETTTRHGVPHSDTASTAVAAPQQTRFPAPLTVGNSVFPWAMRLAIAKYIQDFDGFQLASPHEPCRTVVFDAPPLGYHEAPKHFVKKYLALSPSGRSRLWRQYTREHQIAEFDMETGGPCFYWEVYMGIGKYHYHTPYPYSHALQEGGGVAGQEDCTLSPFWVPVKLLRYLPHLPLPVDAGGGDTENEGALPMTATYCRGTAATPLPACEDEVSAPFPLAQFWTGPRAVGNLKSAYYFPSDCYPYLRATSKLERSRLQSSTKRDTYNNNNNNNCFLPLDNFPPVHHQRETEHMQQLKLWMFRNPAQRSTILFAGDRYVNTTLTNYNSFFDSTVCVRHAIPLDECGRVLLRGIEDIRRRMQDGLDGQKEATAAADSSTSSAIAKIIRSEDGDNNNDDNCEKPQDTASRIWIERVRQLRAGDAASQIAKGATMNQQLYAMSSAIRKNRFLFQSPYWIQVPTMVKRWGVEPALTARPVVIEGVPYVNAEETTDASRFNALTCVPSRIHQLLTDYGLCECSWDASAALHQVLVSGTTHSSAAPQHAAPFHKTHSFLSEEAAAMQSVCNMWVERTIVEVAGWHVDERTAQWQVISDYSSPWDRNKDNSTSNVQNDYEEDYDLEERNNTGMMSRTAVHAVNAAAIAEVGDLVWLLSFTPRVYYNTVGTLGPADEGYDDYKRAQNYYNDLCNEELYESSSNNFLGCLEGARNTAERYAKKQYAEALQRKRGQLRRNYFLPFRSRVQLALLALHRNYSPEHRDVWVTTSFLKDNPLVTAREDLPDGITAVELDVSVRAKGEMTKTSLVFINSSELVWADENVSNWLYKNI